VTSTGCEGWVEIKVRMDGTNTRTSGRKTLSSVELPQQTRFWLEWGCLHHPNSVIPTGADHRKAMICRVEGPGVVTSTGCEGWVEIKSDWTARRRESLGIIPTVRLRKNPAQAELERGTLKRRVV
jgi:hypothetical protein